MQKQNSELNYISRPYNPLTFKRLRLVWPFSVRFFIYIKLSECYRLKLLSTSLLFVLAKLKCSSIINTITQCYIFCSHRIKTFFNCIPNTVIFTTVLLIKSTIIIHKPFSVNQVRYLMIFVTV